MQDSDKTVTMKFCALSANTIVGDWVTCEGLVYLVFSVYLVFVIYDKIYRQL